MKQTVYGAVLGVLFAFLMSGCNDSSSSETTINEESDIPTNSSPFIVVDQGGIDNTTVIDITTGTEVPYTVWVEQNGTNGLVYIRSTPVVPEATDPAIE
jgi:hypothetical protein